MALKVTSTFETAPRARLTRARQSAASANEHVEPTDAASGALPVDRYTRSLTGEAQARHAARGRSADFWQDLVSFGGPLVSAEIGALLLHLQEARGGDTFLLAPPAEIERLLTMYQASNEVGAPPQAPYEMTVDPESGGAVLTLTPD